MLCWILTTSLNLAILPTEINSRKKLCNSCSVRLLGIKTSGGMEKNICFFLLVLDLIYENAHYSYVLKDIFTFYLHKSYSLHLPKVYPLLLKVAFTWSLGVTIFKCLCKTNVKWVWVDNSFFASFSQERKTVCVSEYFGPNTYKCIHVKNGGYTPIRFCEIIFFLCDEKALHLWNKCWDLVINFVGVASCLEINIGNV